MEPMPIERLILDKKIEEKKIVPGGEERLKSLVEFSEENKEGTKAFMKSLFFLIKKGIILRVKGQEHIDDYDSNNIQEYSGNYNKEDIKATLDIHDISEIFTLFYQFKEMQDDENGQSYEWVKGMESLFQLFSNATKKDFLLPEEFLEEMLNALKDETFSHWMENKNIGRFDFKDGHHEDMFINISTQINSILEGPNEVTCAFTDGGKVRPSDRLPVVRFARISENEAVISAVQLGNINRLSRKEIAFFEKNESGLYGYMSEDSFLAQFTKGIKADEFISSIHIIKERMDALSQEEILEEIIYKPQGYYDNIFKILNKLVGLKEAKAEFDRQGRIMKRVNEIISGGLNNKKFKYLRGADPASVVSLALSIKLLHQKGIKDIKFSLMMPLREHGISESLDRDILSRKINIIERCCVELGGLKLLYDESYITLKLPEELAIRTEKLQQLFTMIDNNQEV